MAKPDLVDMYVTASGQIFKDDGESSLAPAFRVIPIAADDSGANTIGVPVGGIYSTSAGVLHVRLA